MIAPEVAEGLDGIAPGDEVIVLTWLDRADRGVLRVHPRDDPANPERGVFSTRSADRPNPIGLHVVEVVTIDGARLRVRNLEAVDGTPGARPQAGHLMEVLGLVFAGSATDRRPEMAAFVGDVLGLRSAPVGGVSADMFGLPDGSFFAVAGPREMGDTSRTHRLPGRRPRGRGEPSCGPRASRSTSRPRTTATATSTSARPTASSTSSSRNARRPPRWGP